MKKVAYPFALVLFFASLGLAPAAEKSAICLYGANENDLEQEGCVSDPLKLSEQPEIKMAIKGFSLENVQINFKGCKRTSLHVSPKILDATHFRYEISYPILEQSKARYIAPIFHEIAHIFQLEKIGNYNALIDKYSSRRIELEADFLAGVLLANFQKNLNQDEFLLSLQVLGKYREADTDAHGTPEQRSSAFLMGANLSFDKFNRQFLKIHEEFQDNTYGYIMSFH
jgi:hypothetical protein